MQALITVMKKTDVFRNCLFRTVQGSRNQARPERTWFDIYCERKLIP